MKIATVGGCINMQKDLASHLHYHALLADMLFQRLGQHPHLTQKTYYNYFMLSHGMQDFLESNPDVFILFIRPFPLHSLLKPIIRYQHRREKPQLALHPFFKKENIIKLNKPSPQSDNSPINPSKNFLLKLLAYINISTGRILQLDIWARNYVRDELQKIDAICKRTNTQFIIIGPPLYPKYQPLNRFCQMLNQYLRQFTQQQKITYIPIATHFDIHGKDIFEPDQIHFNEAGHQFLAQKIVAQICP